VRLLLILMPPPLLFLAPFQLLLTVREIQKPGLIKIKKKEGLIAVKW
jgi:hypothetical protein